MLAQQLVAGRARLGPKLLLPPKFIVEYGLEGDRSERPRRDLSGLRKSPKLLCGASDLNWFRRSDNLRIVDGREAKCVELSKANINGNRPRYSHLFG